MGLDIYAGPLCRYYVRDWKTMVQQWGETQGVPVKVIRPWGASGLKAILRRVFRRPDPALAAVQTVLAWREGLAAEGRFPAGAKFDWPEGFEIKYQTDKPDFIGYGSVQLWAAYAEQPELVRPSELSRDWDNDPAFGAIRQQPPPKFGHIYHAELWLPVSFDDVFEAAEPTSNTCKIGSVFTLWQQLQELNRATWNAPEETVRTWRQEGFDDGALESTARWGFSIWYCLAEFAARNRLPMRLDY